MSRLSPDEHSAQAANDLRDADRLLQIRLVRTALTRARNEAAASLPYPGDRTEDTPAHPHHDSDNERALPVYYTAASWVRRRSCSIRTRR